jgi:hypothetical protein
MKTIQLNRAVLQNIYGDSRESMMEIFSEFLTGYPGIRKSLFSAFESGNLNSFKRVLHYHGPSFNYLGLPEVAGMFHNLKLKCSQVENHFSLSKDFEALMQTMEGSWQQMKNEMECLQKAV